MDQKKNEIVTATQNLSLSLVSTFVGSIVGGLNGALIGAAIPGAISLGEKIVKSIIQRRQKKAEKIFVSALIGLNMDEKSAFDILNNDFEKSEIMFTLIKKASELDDKFQDLIVCLIKECLTAKSNKEIDLVHIISDSLTGLRPIHLNILKIVVEEGGIASPSLISKKLGYDEIELRSVVRKLELEGMLEWLENDNNENWKIREFGMAVERFAFQNGGK